MNRMRSGKKLLSTALAGSLALSTISTVDTAAAEQNVNFTAPVQVSKVETEKASDDASLSSKIGNALVVAVATILLVAMAINVSWQMGRIYAPQP